MHLKSKDIDHLTIAEGSCKECNGNAEEGSLEKMGTALNDQSTAVRHGSRQKDRKR